MLRFGAYCLVHPKYIAALELRKVDNENTPPELYARLMSGREFKRKFTTKESAEQAFEYYNKLLAHSHV